MALPDVATFITTMTRGFEQGDPEMVASVYASDAQLMPPGMEAVTGPSAIAEIWKGAMGAGVRSVRLETSSLEGRDDLAVEVGRYELLADRDGDVLDRGKYVVVYRRQGDGPWKIATDIWNQPGSCRLTTKASSDRHRSRQWGRRP